MVVEGPEATGDDRPDLLFGLLAVGADQIEEARAGQLS
jgi:hypothetical protein